MELTAAQTLAHSLMNEHGLDCIRWSFQFDNAKKRLGLCTYSTKTISMSRYMVAYSDEEAVRQTMLHEIAHALLPTRDQWGQKVGHGPLWKAKAKSLGYTGARTASNAYADAMNPGRAVSEEAKALRPHFDIREGTLVQLTNGTVGRVIKIHQVNYQVKTVAGVTWTARIGTVTLVDDSAGYGELLVAAAAPAVTERAHPGRQVRIISGRLIGEVATVNTKARTRYHATLTDGRRVTIPFEMATPV